MAVTIDVSNIPQRYFIKAIRIRAIVKAKALDLHEKKLRKEKGQDILIKDSLYGESYISKAELISNYVYISGHKIQLFGWRSKKPQYVMQEDNTEVYAIGLSSNYEFTLNGSSLNKKKGKKSLQYLVYTIGSDGGIDRNNPRIFSSKMFKKMFVLPRDNFKELMRATKSKGLNSNNSNFKAVSNIEDKLIIDREEESQNSSRAVSSDNIKDRLSEFKNIIQKSTKSEIIKEVIKEENNKKEEKVTNQLKAVGRLLNSQDTIVGFVLADSNGVTVNKNKKETMMLCNDKRISNLTLATRDAGKKFIRGNGIKIGDLKAYYMNN